METGFTLDKESNTMALICTEVVVVLAFDSRELLIQWQVKVRANLVEGEIIYLLHSMIFMYYLYFPYYKTSNHNEVCNPQSSNTGE